MCRHICFVEHLIRKPMRESQSLDIFLGNMYDLVQNVRPKCHLVIVILDTATTVSKVVHGFLKLLKANIHKNEKSC